MVMIEAREVSQDDELGDDTADIDARSFDSMRRADDLAQGEFWVREMSRSRPRFCWWSL